jgi:hypothetical protein
VVLDTTEASRAVPPEVGALSNDLDVLRREAALLLRDPDEARRRGGLARAAALERYGMERFVRDWDRVLEQAANR